VDDLGSGADRGPAYPVLTGNYAGEQASWESIPIEVGRPLEKPSPLFTKLDPKLGETGPSGRRSAVRTCSAPPLLCAHIRNGQRKRFRGSPTAPVGYCV